MPLVLAKGMANEGQDDETLRELESVKTDAVQVSGPIRCWRTLAIFSPMWGLTRATRSGRFTWSS